LDWCGWFQSGCFEDWVGTLMREQKFYHIRIFTKSNEGNVDEFTSCVRRTDSSIHRS
jgi:hypothetical protein